jgi:hypothetical protein
MLRPALLALVIAALSLTATSACDCGTTPPGEGEGEGGEGEGEGEGEGGEGEGEGEEGEGEGEGVDAGFNEPDPVGDPDPEEGDNDVLDSDCDGLDDQTEFGTLWPSGDGATDTTDPADFDTDGDGISDGVEAGASVVVDARCTFTTLDADPNTKSNPVVKDTDGDCLDDNFEDTNRNGRRDAGESDPQNTDSDNDGLSDGEETGCNQLPGGGGGAGSDPLNPDSDGDGLNDGLEVEIGTNPTEGDSDGDGVADGEEFFAGGDPGGGGPVDSDGDGVSDDQETINGTDPNAADSDGDGVDDGDEDLDGDGLLDPGESDPLSRDSDCDGLTDDAERDLGADPLDSDSDGDGLDDGLESGAVAFGDASCTGTFVADADPTSTSNPAARDSDGDGINDGVEDLNRDGALADAALGQRQETDPSNPDTDEDGLCDGPRGVAPICAAGEDQNGDSFTSNNETDPRVPDVDVDGDGISDAREVDNGTDPVDPDSDNDGLCDGGLDVGGVCVGGEDQNGNGLLDPGETDPSDVDTDCDGVADGEERVLGIDPADTDSDNDGITDGVELSRIAAAVGTSSCASIRFDADPDALTASNPALSDTDGDGIPDGLEDRNRDGAIAAAGVSPRETFPADADSDDDALCDGPRDGAGCSAGEDRDGDGIVDAGETDPRVGNFDNDGDGLRLPIDPNDALVDTDGDGLCDGSVVVGACTGGEDLDNDGIVDAGETNPRLADTDCDAVSDGEERTRATNPVLPDTDNDGVNDGVELGKTARLDCGTARLDADPTSITNPLQRDSDGDGMFDGVEDRNGDGALAAVGANPRETAANDADTDNDGLCDAFVTIATVCVAGEDLDADGVTDAGETDPRVGQFDNDGDGIRTPIDPDDTRADTDGDGLCDGAIAVAAANCIAGEDIDGDGVVDVGETNPRRADSDCDNVNDREEGTRGTDPRVADSDGDLITDGVELGKGTRVDAVNCATAPLDLNTATTTNPLERDSDADGLNDGVEDANKNGRIDAPTPAANETNPADADTDNDNLCDGPASVATVCNAGEDVNRNGRKDATETDPNVADVDSDGDGLSNPDELARGTNPNNADTDGDGINDGLEVTRTNTDPLNADSDCDGRSDGAEDVDSDGIVDASETDPRDADTDNDGLTDGLEAGGICRTTAPPQTSTQCLGTCVVDLNPATTTNPLDADTDNDGIEDGAEDADQNGRVDAGELDPNNANDVGGADGSACGTANLRQITLINRADDTADLILATPTDFPDNRTTTLARNGAQVGAMVFDPTRQVAGVAMKGDLSGATASEKIQTTLNTLLNGALGDVNALSVQTFTSWDGHDAAIGRITWTDAQATDTTAKSLNDIVSAVLGGTVTGTLSTSGSTDTGPYTLQVEVLVRSPTSTIIVMGLARQARVDADEVTLFRVDDLANGSAVAQFGDDTSTQCDRFVVEPAQRVDFVLVVDNSGSMSNEQTAVARAAQEIGARLATSTVDFRIGVLATDVDNLANDAGTWNGQELQGTTGTTTPKLCDFTASVFGLQRCVRLDLNGDGDIVDTVNAPFNETLVRIDLNGDGDAVDTAVATIAESAVAFDINGDGDRADSFTSLGESGLGTNGSGEENGFRPVACMSGATVTGDGINTNPRSNATTNISTIDDSGAGGTVVVTTTAAHGKVVGDRIVVAGVDTGSDDYNATYTVVEVLSTTQLRTAEVDPGADNDNLVSGRGTIALASATLGGAADGEQCGRDGNRAPYPAANTYAQPAGTFRWVPRAENDARKLRPNADLAIIFVTDANEQSDGNYSRNSANYPGDPTATQSIPSWVSFFNDYDPDTAGAQRAFVHGITCANGTGCTDEGNNVYMNPRYQQLIAAMGGIEAALPPDTDVGQAAKIADAIGLILQATVAQASPYVLSKPPISASIKVAFENTVTTFGACNKADVPRSRVNGFDYDGATNSIQFFGTCRPTFDAANLGRPLAVSYKYWIEDSPDPDGNIDPCNCAPPLICVAEECVCPSDCGTGGLGANETCDTTTCEVQCLPDCGGCEAGFTCDLVDCACECNNCNGPPPAPGFTCDLGTCQYECNACPGNPPSPFATCNLATCEYECDDCGGDELPPGFTCNTNPAVCNLQCLPDCGGCNAPFTCDTESCACECEACVGAPPGPGFACNLNTCAYECSGCVGTPPGFATCDLETCQFECTGCGTDEIEPGFFCNTNPLVCALECQADCGGCSGNAQCNTASCACECPADCGGSPPRAGMTCNVATCQFECAEPPPGSVSPGANFVWDPATCAYVCDVDNCGENNIGPAAICDTSTCELRCPADCGGCDGNAECNVDACACECPADCGGPSPGANFTCDVAACAYECLEVPVTPPPAPNFVWDPVSCSYQCPDDCGEAGGVAAPEFCNRTTCEVQCLPSCGGCGANEACDAAACACVCVEDATCAPGFAWNAETCSCGCDTGTQCGPNRELNPDTCACECGDANDDGTVDCNGACGGASPVCQPSLCECRGLGG